MPSNKNALTGKKPYLLVVFFYREFVFPLEYKIMLNKLQKKESSALFMIIITELLILIIMIK